MPTSQKKNKNIAVSSERLALLALQTVSRPVGLIPPSVTTLALALPGDLGVNGRLAFTEIATFDHKESESSLSASIGIICYSDNM